MNIADNEIYNNNTNAVLKPWCKYIDKGFVSLFNSFSMSDRFVFTSTFLCNYYYSIICFTLPTAECTRASENLTKRQTPTARATTLTTIGLFPSPTDIPLLSVAPYYICHLQICPDHTSCLSVCTTMLYLFSFLVLLSSKRER